MPEEFSPFCSPHQLLLTEQATPKKLIFVRESRRQDQLGFDSELLLVAALAPARAGEKKGPTELISS